MLRPLEKLLGKKYGDLRQGAVELRNTFMVRGHPKIFCIGQNKTGTTSLKKAFEDLGYIVGNQKKAELLLRDYTKKNFKSIIDYCKSAQVFQDVPFSFPETFNYLDKAYPNSKFLLSVRDNPEQWYNSLIKFHSKLFGEGELPSSAKLKEATYVRPGWVWECMQVIYKTSEADPYNKEMLISQYTYYNATVMEYFKDRPNDLMVINLAERESYQGLMKILNIDSPFTDFPWENKTADLSIRA